MFNFLFFFNSILIGLGLAMDAFSVSLANGLNEPMMKMPKAGAIAGVFGLFQGAMPLIGWFCVHNIASYFDAIVPFIPWVALALLSFIGGKMLVEGIKECKCKSSGAESCPLPKRVGILGLLVQGVATSIDALSVGFTISNHTTVQAIVCSSIIALVTAILCFGGVYIGKKFGTRFAGKSSIFGGAILIGIGLEIFITSFF
jgi:putative Mn2+ efflux pump MntP